MSEVIPECGNYGVESYELFHDGMDAENGPDYYINYNGKTIKITDCIN